jgi:uncharacterized membrane protein YkvA (DUF1232 family)
VEIGVLLGILFGVLAAWAALVGLIWALRPRNVPLREAIRLVPDLLRLVRSLVSDRAAPFSVRVALGVLLAWLVSPIDLIPEFVPVIGPLDDMIVAVLVLRFVRRRLGEEEFRRRWPGTDTGYELLTAILRERSR